MRYAVVNDLVPNNPVAGVKPADILKPHKKRNYPRVGAKELPALLHAIDGYVGSEHTRLALQLMSLTFVRTSELTGTPWSEFNLAERRWDIPEKRMKMNTPRHVAMNWAKRLKRVFGVEIEGCARCGGKLRIIASIEEPAVIARILAHLEKTAGEESRPELASLAARAPPAQPRLI
jgi:hypothetical protein